MAGYGGQGEGQGATSGLSVGYPAWVALTSAGAVSPLPPARAVPPARTPVAALATVTTHSRPAVAIALPATT